MSLLEGLRSAGPLLTLRETRGLVAGWSRRLVAGAIATVVALLSTMVGGMLTLFPTQGAYTTEVIWWGAPSAWWFYPELLSVQPWGILQLPFFPTVAMLAVAAASGIGATASLVLVARALRRGRRTERRSTLAGASTGAGPGVASFATLGACCCTSCASSGGLAVVAAASGTTAGDLLRVDWYLPLFQLVVVYVILVAQELALQPVDAACEVPRRPDRRFVAGSLLRVLLLVAGVTWSMAMFVEWAFTNPATASAAEWYHWLVEHQLLSGVAILAALFPRGIARALARWRGRRPVGALRALLALGAVSWGVGVPPFAVGWGLGGFLNEALGYAGAPVAWGAVVPDSPLGPALLFHWGVQHLLLAGFGLALAIRPTAALAPLGWSAGVDPRNADTGARGPDGRFPEGNGPNAPPIDLPSD